MEISEPLCLMVLFWGMVAGVKGFNFSLNLIESLFMVAHLHTYLYRCNFKVSYMLVWILKDIGERKCCMYIYSTDIAEVSF